MAAESSKAMQINGFAKYLVENGLLSENDAEKAEYKAKKDDLSIVNFLIKHKILDYKTIAYHTAQYFGLPLIDLEDTDVASLPIAMVDKKLIEKYQILPILKQDDLLLIAITDPTETQILNEIKFHTNLNIKPQIAQYDQLINLINQIRKI